jgi:transposase-like protein
MDISQVQKQRNVELDKFNQEYSESMQKYHSLLQESVRETDPEKQAVLVSHILDVNSDLAKQVREFIQTQPKSETTNLTSELLKIQKEYNQIKESADNKKTLEMIFDEDNNKIKKIKWQFDILIFLLLLCILTILYLIVKVSLSTLLTIQMPLLTSPPT